MIYLSISLVCLCIVIDFIAFAYLDRRQKTAQRACEHIADFALLTNLALINAALIATSYIILLTSKT